MRYIKHFVVTRIKVITRFIEKIPAERSLLSVLFTVLYEYIACKKVFVQTYFNYFCDLAHTFAQE